MYKLSFEYDVFIAPNSYYRLHSITLTGTDLAHEIQLSNDKINAIAAKLADPQIRNIYDDYNDTFHGADPMSIIIGSQITIDPPIDINALLSAQNIYMHNAFQQYKSLYSMELVSIVILSGIIHVVLAGIGANHRKYIANADEIIQPFFKFDKQRLTSQTFMDIIDTIKNMPRQKASMSANDIVKAWMSKLINNIVLWKGLSTSDKFKLKVFLRKYGQPIN
jgi:hypothetical protein